MARLTNAATNKVSSKSNNPNDYTQTNSQWNGDMTANTEKIIDISSNGGGMSHTNAQVKEMINETLNESRQQ